MMGLPTGYHSKWSLITLRLSENFDLYLQVLTVPLKRNKLRLSVITGRLGEMSGNEEIHIFPCTPIQWNFCSLCNPIGRGLLNQ